MTTKLGRVRRCFVDIETSPNIAFVWRAGYDQHITPQSIIGERKIITIAWKWEGEPRKHFLTWDNNKDDRTMLKKFVEVANEADEIIAFYGDRFDLPWVRTRCLIHGLPPIPAWKTVDPKSWASKYYYFNSNKLDYIGQVLGVGKKISVGLDLWKDIVLHNCPIAMAKMVQYNIQDVVLLEKVYQKLRFCVKPKTHAGVMAGGERWTCPRDGSTNVHLDKVRVTSSGVTHYQFRCNDCGGYFTLNSVQYEAYKKHKNRKPSRSRHHK